MNTVITSNGSVSTASSSQQIQPSHATITIMNTVITSNGSISTPEKLESQHRLQYNVCTSASANRHMFN